MKVPCITLQMLDISDTIPQNITDLAEAIIKCKEKYDPGFYMDCRGTLFISVFRHTSFDKVYDSKPHKGNQNSAVFTPHTSDYYSVVKVTAEIDKNTLFDDQSLELETENGHFLRLFFLAPPGVILTVLCTGLMTQWGNKLLTLDFCSTVRAMCKTIEKVKMDDYIATFFCMASSS
ncbi:hypothetical protein P7K49_010434 [Saguinus oedipus]|uniref:Uncharacterized protein n=1 Tax=Saguinus oedipus TaxID=9490 RepID=A0ABQ9VMS9_SAGOE|nr:hypothetical protein P7K49_010434 [Saguinus oedipus]